MNQEINRTSSSYKKLFFLSRPLVHSRQRRFNSDARGDGAARGDVVVGERRLPAAGMRRRHDRESADVARDEQESRRHRRLDRRSLRRRRPPG